tara:strand:- start:115 stop:543 length:429 start_codon:yes stop_codon:yes gene_type:complete
VTNELPKRNRLQRASTKKLRDARAIEMAINGITQQEIANELNVNRTTVNRILSSAEVKQILKDADSRIHSLVAKALDTVDDALNGRATDMTNGLKASIALLKSTGALKDKIDIAHTFPKPTIITKRDGTEVVLGVKAEDENE